MDIDVVLSAYNGAKYITEQLDSLRAQARPFDRVLICDDCSTDDTADIVESYIYKKQLPGWLVTRNTNNLGWKKNFHDLIQNASGDYIFPCDQDDIWLPEKSEIMVSVMESHPEIDVLACSVEPFYESGAQETGAGTMEAVGESDVLVYQGVDEKAIYVQRPGCAYCVRRSFVDEVTPFWPDDWAHDVVLWTLSEMKGSLYLYNRRLMKFRRHANNASARKRITRASRLEDLAYQMEKVQRMELFGEERGYLTDAKQLSLAEIRRWLEARRAYLESGSLGALEKIVAGRNHYRTSRGLPVDLYLGTFKNASI